MSDDFTMRAARLLRAAANDLKRDDASAEADLGLAAGEFARITRGERAFDWTLIRRAAQVWPLNERDLLPVHDDCPDGVRVHRLADSVRSSRIINRGGNPYYEYRDTAMSTVASYRPEWIRMIRTVTDSSPDNPAVEWNRGHLLYQFTYFVGPVNYYYRWEGDSHCVEMNTGDSVWGVPFAPHSFTARSAAEPAYILALTYGGDLVGDAQRELSVLGPQAARAMALSLDHAALLRSFLQARLVTPAVLATSAGLDRDRVERICAGEETPDIETLGALARALGVPLRELLPAETQTKAGVHLQTHANAARWEYGSAYRITRLAGDPVHPHTTALEVAVVPSADADWLTTYQHQYLYVLDGAPVRLRWEHRGRRQEALLAPGDSGYVLPQTPIALASDDAATVLLLRIGGATTTDVRFALSGMPAGGIERYLDEDRLWFRADNGEEDK
ncbi:helix-turn-helix domain-containing protein [Planosporangium sp. 12N6]|uniref:helix-turn-helix domain-containing protein n=1 Tax=Planosporangium spinosum TaxID=3402278 RepID=UPI003CF5209A